MVVKNVMQIMVYKILLSSDMLDQTKPLGGEESIIWVGYFNQLRPVLDKLVWT